ncbi:hypothetical protein CYMTET_7462 [Cymbomonas tetramitiformis]|uniref:Uncharacterized protein n=1 Tax=Cymbomonas tetramitiformis TaxID=36881 RepID=A0AAE0LH20_9CHLO|nr:hypothetical protein CYMTET_7462 [Cymbomonas tetramitiformis]|eukprot:gene204-368_t
MSSNTNELVRLVKTLMCDTPDRCFAILETSMRNIPIPFFVMNSMTKQLSNDGSYEAVHVDKCCEWISSIITGLHNEGDSCQVEMNSQMLNIGKGIQVPFSMLTSKEKALWIEIMADPERFFRKVDRTYDHSTSYDEEQLEYGNFLKCGCCYHNMEIQKLLQQSAFILQFVILFLYVKVNISNRFTVGYKTLLLVCQKSIATKSNASIMSVAPTSGSENTKEDSLISIDWLHEMTQKNTRTADHKLQCIIESLFYYWYDLQPTTIMTDAWSGCISSNTIWAVSWSTFHFIRSVHPTFSGQRRASLQSLYWASNLCESNIHIINHDAAIISSENDHTNGCVATISHKEHSVYDSMDCLIHFVRQIFDLTATRTEEINDQEAKRNVRERCIISISKTIAALYKQVITQQHDYKSTNDNKASAGIVRKRPYCKQLTVSDEVHPLRTRWDCCKCILYALYVWGEGFDHHIPELILKIQYNILFLPHPASADRFYPDDNLLPYLAPSSYWRNARNERDWPWRYNRSQAKCVFAIRKYIMEEHKSAIEELYQRISTFVRTTRILYGHSEHWELPHDFWQMCFRNRESDKNMKCLQKLLQHNAPQCEHLLQLFMNANLNDEQENASIAFEKVLTKELLHIFFAESNLDLRSCEFKQVYCVGSVSEVNAIMTRMWNRGYFREVESILDSLHAKTEARRRPELYCLKQEDKPTDLLNLQYTFNIIFQSRGPQDTKAEICRVYRVDEKELCFVGSAYEVDMLHLTAVILDIWNKRIVSLENLLKKLNQLRNSSRSMNVWILNFLIDTTWKINDPRFSLAKAKREETGSSTSITNKALLELLDWFMMNITDLCSEELFNQDFKVGKTETMIGLVKLLKGKRVRTDISYEKDALIGIFHLMCCATARVCSLGMSEECMMSHLQKLKKCMCSDLNVYTIIMVLEDFCTQEFLRWCTLRCSFVKLKSIHCSKRDLDKSDRVIKNIIKTFLGVQRSNKYLLQENPKNVAEIECEDDRSSDVSSEDKVSPLTKEKPSDTYKSPAANNGLLIPVLFNPFHCFMRNHKNFHHPLWTSYPDLFEAAYCHDNNDIIKMFSILPNEFAGSIAHR